MRICTPSLGRRSALGLALGLAFGAGPALSHHGWSGYSDEPFTLTGVVEAIHLGNPHGHLEVVVDGQVWEVVLGPPRRNRRAGIEEGVVRIGDPVRAYGKRHRDPGRLEMKTERLEINGTAYDIYPERL